MLQQQIFDAVFKNSANLQSKAEYLEAIKKEYPYFGLAHFFALKNTDSNIGGFNEAAAITALFFESPFYLNSLLNNEEIAVEQVQDILETTLIEPLPVTTPSADEQQHNEETTVVISTKENEVELVQTVTTENESPMLFEPLHASDYFASQGIKLSDDLLAGDKLAIQLKSFTSWLKTMKKLHPDKLATASPITDTAVQAQAEKSNVENEIVTEPMAEAYILQNKIAKAIDIYQKLSLLNPAKSAFFAAKIDSLKQ